MLGANNSIITFELPLKEKFVAEGFGELEEVAYVPLDELASIEGFDEELAQELQNTEQPYRIDVKAVSGPTRAHARGTLLDGTEVLTCGTCLNHYGLADRLAVGTVTNMYVIAEVLSAAGRVIRPGAALFWCAARAISRPA